MPPGWQEVPAPANGHSHDQSQATNGTQAQAAAIQVAAGQNGTTVSPVTTQTVEAVVVELSNGTKLLICPL